ncbi:restriction endonuclease subunit S [Sulfobacillus thermosulfidooxidans]|uniref:restriction endonuclease subunit S n=1 Tax=Sulfobacillus thermosulfidooxidans TaxID=28034 RepID=UPI0006B49C69|nr:restriction endonuclease subunit S [Sulfobacillus thermosulfidooxidans]
MNADLLIAQFDRIAEAPDAVPRLRRFILDLAVRGRLVEQDPTDGRTYPRLPTGENTMEGPYELPLTWQWYTIGDITANHGQKVPDRDFTYIDVSAIDSARGVVENPQILKPNEAPSRARRIVQSGDVIYATVRPYLLNVAVIDRDYNPPAIASTAFVVLSGIGFTLPRFLWLVLRSPYFVKLVEEQMRGQAYPAINDRAFKNLPIPLPPLQEQHRIVAKVDELMAVCDELEARQQERETQRDRTVMAVLHTLVEKEQKDRAFVDTVHFYLRNFADLTVRREHVQQLRRTILDLAVRGKLVENDVIPFQAENSFSGELPYVLPDSWRWVTLGDVGDWGAGTTPPRSESSYYGGGITWLKSGELNDTIGLTGSEETVTQLAIDRLSFRLNKPGDLLLAMYGATIGKLAILGEFAVTNQAVCGCTPYEGISTRYLFIYLLSQRNRLRGKSEGGAQPNISKTKILKYPCPLPPLSEQHRIVAKVDELMAVCDALEQQLIMQEQDQQRFMEAALREAMAPAEQYMLG